jgi:uncharacterized phage-associated protein
MTKPKITIDDLADYIIWKFSDDDRPLNLLKLQKLAYYAQAWHLALFDSRLVDEEFQAWVHGPVSRRLYDRFSKSPSTSLYGVVTNDDIRKDFRPKNIPSEVRAFIDEVVDEYGKYNGSQLEEMTHSEKPWKEARHGYMESERCEIAIKESTMRDFYRARAAT